MSEDHLILQELRKHERLLAEKIGQYAQDEEDAQVRRLLQEIQNVKEQHLARLDRHLEPEEGDHEQS